MSIELTARPIFVVGSHRSGTSMMQWALRQHPELWGGPESDFMIPLHEQLTEIHRFGTKRGKLHWLSRLDVSAEELVRYVGYGINALYTNRSGGRRWVEQTPEYTLALDWIADLFPGCVFLFMVRDGRQVVESLRNFVTPYSHDDACRTWRRFTDAGLQFQATERGQRLLLVRYEAMVSETDKELGRVYRFLEEDVCTKSVDFVRNQNPINSSFKGESSQDKLKPRWQGWSAAERERFLEITGDLLVRLGYEPDSSWANAVDPGEGGALQDDG